MPNLGELNKRVRVLQRSDVRDEVGGITNTPTLVATLWAKVVPVGTGNSYQDGRLESNRTHVVTFRSNEVVKVGHMLQVPVPEGQPQRYLRVMGVKRVRELEWWLECDCEERDSWP